ncbi:unnamed protein product [[Candida] boidinii]|uniref:Unnamed protein product n=1 Tax=Candida boidinii TaxID=5477 RepID=A0A9W6WE94_CANBO|nr:hypothetical protein B5S30_g2770 [[Candida] boidinii]GME67286.1 unnamed protein product [[Candida] boidinii]GMG19260.1 unnamed protein product [[Candida] boidinii]
MSHRKTSEIIIDPNNDNKNLNNVKASDESEYSKDTFFLGNKESSSLSSPDVKSKESKIPSTRIRNRNSGLKVSLGDPLPLNYTTQHSQEIPTSQKENNHDRKPSFRNNITSIPTADIGHLQNSSHSQQTGTRKKFRLVNLKELKARRDALKVNIPFEDVTPHNETIKPNLIKKVREDKFEKQQKDITVTPTTEYTGLTKPQTIDRISSSNSVQSSNPSSLDNTDKLEKLMKLESELQMLKNAIENENNNSHDSSYLGSSLAGDTKIESSIENLESELEKLTSNLLPSVIQPEDLAEENQPSKTTALSPEIIESNIKITKELRFFKVMFYIFVCIFVFLIFSFLVSD